MFVFLVLLLCIIAVYPKIFWDVHKDGIEKSKWFLGEVLISISF